MSRYSLHNQDTHFIFEAAEYWRDHCLLNDGSVFSDEKLWKQEYFQDDLQKYFIDNLDDGTGSFLKKLKTQLADARPEIKRLAAEIMWVLYLGQSKAAIGKNLKRQYIEEMWRESNAEIPNPEFLEDNYLEGIGRFGRAFMTQLWQEWITFIYFMQEWKKASQDMQNMLLKSHSAFCEFFEERAKTWDPILPSTGQRVIFPCRALLHILPYLLFPDELERIFSIRQKRKIVSYFTNDSLKNVNGMSIGRLNEELRKIREDKEKEYPGKNLDFFIPPLDEWRKETPTPATGVKEKMPQTSDNTKLIPLNQIFYGPPGTSKTYNTVSEALQIILGEEKYDAIGDDREEMNARFKALRKTGQIQFVTFHQNFAYEDFIEGLKADTNDDEQIRYDIKPGVFKSLCERAAGGESYTSIEAAIEKLKKDCEETPIPMMTTKRGNRIEVSYRGGKTFRVKPLDSANRDHERDSPASIENIIKVYRGANLYDFYSPSYIRAILQYLKNEREIPDYPISQDVVDSSKQPYVLIIDEINRGNISRIFGELITLIEESRRAGNKDALEVILPYSKDPFSVPDNLYIIGTMNTADRSIALLDTALRRRFRFKEMMPDPDVLTDNGIENIAGVDIPSLLKALNQRLEALYDRDHQIGHTYFLRLKKKPDIEQLADIFQHDILPLLQEYFYEDWDKIDLALNRNGFLKKEEPLKLKDDDGVDEEKKIWRIDKEALMNADRYIAIYRNDRNHEETDQAS